MFWLINLQETKTCQRWNCAAKAICSDIRLDSLDILISAELNLFWNKFKSFIKKIYMEEGFVLMNFSKHKRWTANRVISKQ